MWHTVAASGPSITPPPSGGLEEYYTTSHIWWLRWVWVNRFAVLYWIMFGGELWNKYVQQIIKRNLTESLFRVGHVWRFMIKTKLCYNHCFVNIQQPNQFHSETCSQMLQELILNARFGRCWWVGLDSFRICQSFKVVDMRIVKQPGWYLLWDVSKHCTDLGMP